MKQLIKESDIRLMVLEVINEVFSLLQQERHPDPNYKLEQSWIDSCKKVSDDCVRNLDRYLKDFEKRHEYLDVREMVLVLKKLNEQGVIHDRTLPRSREFLNTKQRNEVDALYQTKNDCLEKVCMAINKYPECGVRAVISEDEEKKRVIYFIKTTDYHRDLQHKDIKDFSNKTLASFHLNAPNYELSQHGIIIHRKLIRRGNDNDDFKYNDELQRYIRPKKEVVNPYEDCETIPFNERASIMQMPNGKYTLANNKTHKPFYNDPSQMFDGVEDYNNDGNLCFIREVGGKMYVYEIDVPLKGSVRPITKVIATI